MPVRVPRAKLEIRKNFFCVRGPEIWNSLSSEIRQSTSLNAFKVRRKDREKNIQIKTARLFVPYGFGNLHAKFQPSSSIITIYFIAPNIRDIRAERKKNEKDAGQMISKSCAASI